MSSQLPAPKLVRTTHTDDGTSIFAADDIMEPFRPFGPSGPGFTVFDARTTVPVKNTEATQDLANTLPRCPPAGVLFTTADYPGNGFTVPMHRTLTMDYAVVLSGEIVLALDGGEEKTVRAGEFMVQQGTNHKWINRASDPCRVLFVMVGAEKISLSDGTILEETAFKR